MSDIRETNRDLARLAAEASKMEARARRAQGKADEAHAESLSAKAAWHKAWEAAGPVGAEAADTAGDQQGGE